MQPVSESGVARASTAAIFMEYLILGFSSFDSIEQHGSAEPTRTPVGRAIHVHSTSTDRCHLHASVVARSWPRAPGIPGAVE
jgi:hypothetical protein